MTPLYRIANWDAFENSKSRERDRCSFVCLPNKQDGLGLAYLLSEPDGAAVLGVWTLLVQACSRHPRPRAGWVSVDGHPAGTPWAPEDLALRWRRPIAEINRMLQVCSSPKVGWLIVESARAVPADGHQTGTRCPGREGKGKEGEGREGTPTPLVNTLGEEPGDAPGHDHIGIVLRELLLPDDATTRQEWAALCLEARSESDDEDARAIRWTVRTQRAQGVTVRYAREALPALPAWGAYKRKLAAKGQA